MYAYHHTAPEVDRVELRRIRDTMLLRGPDGVGEWFSEDGRVALGHRRLAIIDPQERSQQPLATRDGSLIVVFNGEIYNYRELRVDLQKRGHSFRTESDTEVLLYLYAEEGENLVRKLRGMFAFALWDKRKGILLLARDPYGIKPLYYADDGWTVRIASQVKALMAGQKISRDPEPAGMVGFFLWGSVPEPYTIYQEVRQVPAGAIVKVTRLGPEKPQAYFSVAQTYREAYEQSAMQGNGSRNKLASDERQAVHEILRDSVIHHMVSDVPVGIFLSSGIDSGALLSLLHDSGVGKPDTVTVSFREFQGSADDETEFAEEIARKYGTRHRTCVVTEEEFQKSLDKIFQAMDQPTIDGINAYFVAKAARETGLKVALSGIGGDELFGGYPSFRTVPLLARSLIVPSYLPLAGDLFRHATRWLRRLGWSRNPKHEGLVKYGGTYPGAYFLCRGLFLPWELPRFLDEEVVKTGLQRLNVLEPLRQNLMPDPKTDFGRVASLESCHYLRNQLLRDADWAGMAHSLEIRTPYADSFLLKRLSTYLLRPNSHRPHPKNLLIESLNGSLDPEWVSRRKTGFNVPMEAWIQQMKVQHREDTWAREWARMVMQRQGIASEFVREEVTA
jgi:asparagine synthase (glutamine-hydrolysing)